MALPEHLVDFAPKLLISELLVAPVVQTSQGIHLQSHGVFYNHIQVQGRLVITQEGRFCVCDATGTLPVDLPLPRGESRSQAAAAGSEVKPGDIVVATGQVYSPEGCDGSERRLRASRVVILADCGPDEAWEQWVLEIDELVHAIYPRIAQTQLPHFQPQG